MISVFWCSNNTAVVEMVPLLVICTWHLIIYIFLKLNEQQTHLKKWKVRTSCQILKQFNHFQKTKEYSGVQSRGNFLRHGH
jgi:hypothetical protein